MQRLIEVTHEFQSERKGLHEHNDVYTSIRRAEMEIMEAWEAFYIGTQEELKRELMDVAMFVASALISLGVQEQEADRLMMEKHRSNQRRYAPEFFDRVGQQLVGKEYKAEDALKAAKSHDTKGWFEGSDVY